MTDLDKLIEAVEAGREWHTIPGSLVASVIGLDNVRHFAAAASDDLNAVHALHKAVLPGWRWCVGQNVHHGDTLARVYRVAGDDIQEFNALTEPTSTPARAWLLAILRAMKEQKGECDQ